MRLAGLDLNLLVVLDALLTESNVTAAAGRIGLSQSATSHNLARLRELLDDPILLRTSKGMVPTSRAAALAPTVRQILVAAETVFRGEEDFDPAELGRRAAELIAAGDSEEAVPVLVEPELVVRGTTAAPPSGE